jgi:hypothetical protein
MAHYRSFFFFGSTFYITTVSTTCTTHFKKYLWGGGGYNSKRQSLATLRSLGQQSRPGEDRSWRLILHRPVKVKLCQGVGPPPRCTAAGSEQRLGPCALVVYLGTEGEQGAPYSSLTIHVVPPLACMGLGNVECKCRLVRL